MNMISCTPQDQYPERHPQFLRDKADALSRGPIDVVFIGDSILDEWRRDLYRVSFEEYWGEYNVYNMAVGGNETQHVLWRLQHGQLDGVLPRLIVLMIGTNNVGVSRMGAAETIAGIRAVIEEIRKRLPQVKILLLAILPCERGPQPNNLRQIIRLINQNLAAFGDTDANIAFHDFSHVFLNRDDTVRLDRMPDGLHPNEPGYRAWGQALRPVIEQMLDQRAPVHEMTMNARS